MARRRRNRKKLDTTPREINIESLAHDGRGVGRGEDGKVVFVDYALPGEKVIYVPVMNRKSCLLYTSPSPRDQRGSRMPSSA